MKNLLREIPGIDKMVKNACFKKYPDKLVIQTLRSTTNKIREDIINHNMKTDIDIEKVIIKETLVELEKVKSNNLRKVINATGVILNTNLGRAPVQVSVLKNLIETGGGYSNLEFDIETGERGDRHSSIEKLLKDITGAEDAIIVNNNAAAVLLILDTFAKHKEVIVSRGELIEIGGSFRLPDILKKSDCKLVEVGTTNRTYIEDFENKITKKTALLFKAHTSNYKILGFAHNPSLKELVTLGNKNNVIVVEDVGSGLFVDFTKFDLPYEPTVQEIINTGVDIVSFSGDKLLGGSQCGVIVGKKIYVEKLKKNPLFRALRVGKLTLSCLESILRTYLYDEDPVSKIPILSMIKEPVSSLKLRAKKLHNGLLKTLDKKYQLKIENSESEIGGGAYPGVKIPSIAITITSTKESPNAISKNLRRCEPSVISRITDNKVWLDLRTIFEEDINLILRETKKWL
ncbi:MAG: L-seryl-tRNA(Sec) selenium transferase [bacterium]